MSGDERIEMARLATAFEAFVKSYEREETERAEWRRMIENKLNPIYSHHLVVVTIGKWFGAAMGFIGSLFAAVKGWFWLSDHLKK